ncbi:MAG TPA: FAD-dependent oxidoreductase [Thermoleophilia bacterium]|nr:FAD-dependent oxidoreductase [Thermoleophilia bacterium]
MEEMVGRLDDLPEGAMREVSVGGKKVLLLKSDGAVRAYGARCPHYDAHLAEGLLHDGRIVCPLHQSTFQADTGDLLEPPALSGLPQFTVRVEGGEIWVEIPDKPPRVRTMPMASRDGSDEHTFAVVGGGAAGAAAVEALRQHGFTGRILLISREDRWPYDRPNLSKDYLAGKAGADWLPLRSDSFYEKHGIERLCGQVASFDALSRRIVFDDGSDLTPDAVLLAPGGVPRAIDVPGAGLPQVFTLRSWTDCDRIIAAVEGAARAVVVGAGFIGMEAAASLRERGLEVAVVLPEEVPLAKQLGPDAGRMLMTLHEEHGVHFRPGRTVREFAGDDRLVGVALDDGSRLDADLAIVGVGVQLATDFIGNVTPNDDGSLDVDDQLRVNPQGVWAAGDVARFPEAHVGGRARIEHWRLAEQHGRTAAASMAGVGTPFTAVPFFWTQQYDLQVSYAGVAGAWDESFVTGDAAARDFVTFFVRDGGLIAAAGTRGREIDVFSELMRLGRLPDPGSLRGREQSDLARLL